MKKVIKRCYHVNDGYYLMSATVSFFLDFEMPQKFHSSRSRKYKKGMVVLLENPYDEKVVCWDESQDNVLFYINGDKVLSDIIKQSGSMMFATITDLEENENDSYKVAFLFHPKKLSKKYIIDEEQIAERPSFIVSVPVSQDIVNLATEEIECYKKHKQHKYMRLTASPFVIGRIIVSDLESDGFIAKLEDTKLYDYLETKGQVESFLNNIDMPSDYVVNLEFVIEKELDKPLTIDELKMNAPYDLVNCGFIVSALYTTPTGESRYHNLTDGLIQSNIVGTSFVEDYDEFSDLIKVSDEVILRKQPDNPADNNAIAAYWNGKRIGYIPRINLPVVTLFMPEDEMSVQVYENNLGWIAIEFPIDLKKAQLSICQHKFGPMIFKIIKDNRAVKVSFEQLLSIFN